MFYYQNSALGPNPLAASTEEEEEHRYKRRTRLLRDVGNEPVQRSKTDVLTGKRPWLDEKGPQLKGEDDFQSELKKLYVSKKANVIMQFSSEDEDDDEQPAKTTETNHKQYPEVSAQIEDAQQEPEASVLQKPRKNNFLLAFSDEQNSSEEVSRNTAGKAVEKQQQTFRLSNTHMAKNNLILNFEQESQEEVPSKDSLQFMGSCNPGKDVLAIILSQYKEKYYLEAIPEPLTLQCIIKRERTTSTTRYQIHDTATLRNIMTVIKSEDGYLFISKYEHLNNCPPSSKGETVVAKLLSNFFGTEFNCYLWSYPYKKFADFTIDPDKSGQVITIEYETNIFGMKGPRKMSAYIPTKQSVVSKKRLNELLEYEKKKRLPSTVQKFKNKTPKWNSRIEAYVLNFQGRATVSSIKNFIMVDDGAGEDAEHKILFGKFGKDLFNLDIRYPFSLLQGVALALSSFDKKLACE